MVFRKADLPEVFCASLVTKARPRLHLNNEMPGLAEELNGGPRYPDPELWQPYF